MLPSVNCTEPSSPAGSSTLAAKGTAAPLTSVARSGGLATVMATGGATLLSRMLTLVAVFAPMDAPAGLLSTTENVRELLS